MWLTSHVQCCGFNVTQLQCVKTGEPSALWFYNHKILQSLVGIFYVLAVFFCRRNLVIHLIVAKVVSLRHEFAFEKKRREGEEKKENSLDVFGLQRSSWLYSSIGGTWWSMWLAKMDLLRLDFAFQKGNMKAKKKINILWTASETSASGDGCDW